MQKLPINDATDTQVNDFATNTLQLNLSGASSRAQVLALIAQAWPQDYILVDDAPAAVPNADQVEKIVGNSGQKMGGVGKDDPVVVLTIGQTEQPGGKDPVPVSVNGRNIVIQRGLEAPVPYRFYEALINSERVIVTQNLEAKFGSAEYGEIIETKTTNYPMHVRKLPTDEEVEAWRERTGPELMPA